MSKIRIKKNKPFLQENALVLAHRGDSHSFPENTLLAFKSAVKMNVDVIETDVHISKDGVIFIWHDKTLERLSGLKGNISNLNWVDILKADAGYYFSVDDGRSFPFRDKGITVVKLKDLLIAMPNVKFNIDLKDKSACLVKKYVGILKSTQAIDRVCTASFHSVNLKQFRKLLPQAATCFSGFEIMWALLFSKLGLLRFRKNFKGDIFQGPIKKFFINIATSSFIDSLHSHGIPVQFWTINDKKEMNRLLDLGVDGIFTDNPELLIKVKREREMI